MRKIIVLVLAAVLGLGLVGCSAPQEPEATESQATEDQVDSQIVEETPKTPVEEDTEKALAWLTSLLEDDAVKDVEILTGSFVELSDGTEVLCTLANITMNDQPAQNTGMMIDENGEDNYISITNLWEVLGLDEATLSGDMLDGYNMARGMSVADALDCDVLNSGIQEVLENR